RGLVADADDDPFHRVRGLDGPVLARRGSAAPHRLCHGAADYPPAPMRRPLALVVAALVSAFAALVLGEYDLTGFTPLVAGLLLGVVVGEAAVLVVRERDVVVTAGSAACAGAAVVW